ncbi:hypothetical protein VA596_34490 [Amycolatopsis sp., V23-08]|uniref:PhzF family phenazine biosynthesis protein n=1 Tax=Amycolatopsis heterodermiae TaxID=3110235 RepID=A0ABU5RGF5_9PSEU|nr:hypothetical protein [Amycolatopsis sp., V23-08]MEA5364684.1 hypothetical protein [Amycolatopsis sp., V23-08]
MRFRESDVVANLLLNVETEEFGKAVAVCRPPAAEFGASAWEIRRADPEGGRKGFTVSLFLSCPVAEAESPEEALRRAVLPVALEYRLDVGALEIHGKPGEGGYADLPFDDREVGGYLVYGLLAAPGGGETRAATYVTRPDFTPRADSDLVSRVHLRLPVADPGRALDRCAPIVAATRASVVQVVSARAAGRSDELCEVALLSAVPAVEGEAEEDGLRRVATALAAGLGLDGRPVTVRGSSAELVLEPGEAEVESLSVRVEDDPLYVD